MEPKPEHLQENQMYYVRDTEEGWGCFRRSDGKPVAGPSSDWGIIVRICTERNRRELVTKPEDV